MYFQELWIIFFCITLFECCHCVQLELGDTRDRVNQGKKHYEQLREKSTDEHTPCWKEAMSKLDVSCRDIKDMEQSFLALQFANCHLEKSGLETFSCSRENFKDCTRKMGSNIIAFQTYTEFFTHVSDICFYLQNEIWREKTENTISKLQDVSVESLEKLSRSVQQQQEVLSSQEQSLQNQKDMLANEKILKEALLTSAQSAKDVFNEVREHAQQQKTMFSETFDNVFQSVERLANLQTMLLGEFIGLQSVAFYFVASIVCYLFTSAPRTASARLPLFVTLSLLIVSERAFVGWKVNLKEELSAEEIHSRIWSLRKLYLVLATAILGFFVMRYRDFNKINHNMLQDIQMQILELRRLHEMQQKRNAVDLDKTDGASENDQTLIDASKKIEEATKQLELSLAVFATSTPHKINEQNDTFNFNKDGGNATLISAALADKLSRQGTKKGQMDGDCAFSNETNETAINASRYNLRSRRSSGFGTLVNSQLMESTGREKEKSTKRNRRKSKSNKPAFFSSDEEC